MIRKIIFVIMIFSFFSNLSADYHKLAYDYKFKGLDGNQINLKDYNDKVIVVAVSYTHLTLPTILLV